MEERRREYERKHPELRERIDEFGFRAATEGFQYHGQHWDIFLANQQVADREPDLLFIDDDLKAFVIGTSVKDPDWALQEAGLSRPILVIRLPHEVFGPDAGDLVIDGYHRLTRAIADGLTEVPAHFLTAEDERACRKGETWDSLAPHEPWQATRRATD